MECQLRNDASSVLHLIARNCTISRRNIDLAPVQDGRAVRVLEWRLSVTLHEEVFVRRRASHRTACPLIRPH